MSERRKGEGELGGKPLQFSLRSILAVMVAVSLVFGTLRWLGVSAFAAGVILILMVVSIVVAVGLVVVISRAADDGP